MRVWVRGLGVGRLPRRCGCALPRDQSHSARSHPSAASHFRAAQSWRMIPARLWANQEEPMSLRRNIPRDALALALAASLASITHAGLDCCNADLTGDNSVAADDLAILLGAWGTPDADLSGDGTTNGT